MLINDEILKRFILLAAFLSFWSVSCAQLLSPGKLSESHKKLEGISNCTSCHTLGQKGISNDRCLSCHTPLKARIEDLLGYHANDNIIDQNCSNCHKEHFGRDFEIIKWDTASFDHDETGFTLLGKHTDLSCGSCHDSKFITYQRVLSFKSKHGALEQTFLGLGADCSSCHESDSPHGKQFTGQDCQSCHNANNWTDLAAFDHSKARFDLVGKHLNVECASCHTTVTAAVNTQMVKYVGLEFEECIDCHTDVHDGSMGTQCSTCHSASGWNQLVSFSERTFDHSSTGFPLVGKHQTVSCKSCHQPNSQPSGIDILFVQATINYSYPHPRVTGKCISCHEDYHDGAFEEVPGGKDCANCHTEGGWLPTTFGTQRHNSDSPFALTGAHLAIPCSSCHQPADNSRMVFHFEDTQCETCHEQDNPHGNEFADQSGKTVCGDCHETTSWTSDISFDHSTTQFPLTGRHALISCNSCHNSEFALADNSLKLPVTCESCHQSDDPHRGQFKQSAIGSSCDNCHSTDSFTLTSFDHSKTRFPLDGAHENVACMSCHQTEKAPDGSSFVRFRPMKITCESCHANNNQ